MGHRSGRLLFACLMIVLAWQVHAVQSDKVERVTKEERGNYGSWYSLTTDGAQLNFRVNSFRYECFFETDKAVFYSPRMRHFALINVTIDNPSDKDFRVCRSCGTRFELKVSVYEPYATPSDNLGELAKHLDVDSPPDKFFVVFDPATGASIDTVKAHTRLDATIAFSLQYKQLYSFFFYANNTKVKKYELDAHVTYSAGPKINSSPQFPLEMDRQAAAAVPSRLGPWTIELLSRKPFTDGLGTVGEMFEFKFTNSAKLPLDLRESAFMLAYMQNTDILGARCYGPNVVSGGGWSAIKPGESRIGKFALAGNPDRRGVEVGIFALPQYRSLRFKNP